MGIIQFHEQKAAIAQLSQFGASRLMGKLLPYAIRYLRQRETIQSVGLYDKLTADGTQKAIALVVALKNTNERDTVDAYRAAPTGVLPPRSTHSYLTSRELPEKDSRLGVVLDLAYRYPGSIGKLRTAIREHGYSDSGFLVEIMEHDASALVRGML